MKKINTSVYLYALLLIAFFVSASAAQAGGQFAIPQSVVASSRHG